MIFKNEFERLVEMATKEIARDCPVCGMDDWCGTDGCPMDPQ